MKLLAPMRLKSWWLFAAVSLLCCSCEQRQPQNRAAITIEITGGSITNLPQQFVYTNRTVIEYEIPWNRTLRAVIENVPPDLVAGIVDKVMAHMTNISRIENDAATQREQIAHRYR